MFNYKALEQKVKNKQLAIMNKGDSQNDCLLPLWLAWYNGYIEDFHRYYIYNGLKKKYFVKKQMKMWKRVSEDWASLLMNEHVDIVVDDYELLRNKLIDLNFWTKSNNAVELAWALGYSGLAVDIDNLTFNGEKDKDGNILNATVVKNPNTRIGLSKYNATEVIPLNTENDEITECAFIKGDDINMHVRDEKGFYHIILVRGKDKERTYTDIATTSIDPLFAIFKPNIENNLYINSPYPLPICANSIDALKKLDNDYDAMDNEITLGRKRIFISADMNKMNYEAKDSDGNNVTQIESTFDTNDTMIYSLPNNGLNNEKPLVFSPNDPLRIDQLIMAIDRDLQILSSKVGLGANFYRFDKSGVMTATQVISENSDTYRNLRKHEILLEKQIINIVKAIIYCNNNFTTEPEIKGDEVKVLFDDSIIEDKQTEQKNDKANITIGAMSLVEYRMKWFGETEEVATEKIYEINGRDALVKRINNYLPAYNSGLMTAKMFVNLAYTDEDLKACGVSRDELIAALDAPTSNNQLAFSEFIKDNEYNPNENPNTENE